jgi:hypothetical protein
MTPNSSVVMAQLQVNRSELVKGLQTLARHTKLTHTGEVILRFKEGRLEVRIGGVEISAAASGRWPGEARAPGSFLLPLVKHAPEVDPLPIRVEADRLHVAGLSIPCHWQTAGAALVEIPIGATLAEILRIGMRQTKDTLEQSGILKRVEDARARRRALVVKAVALLKPLDVRTDDVERMVDSCLQIISDRHARGDA